ncbi:hypothetical protein Efla_001510 [Eimeria flavescens]
MEEGSKGQLQHPLPTRSCSSSSSSPATDDASSSSLSSSRSSKNSSSSFTTSSTSSSDEACRSPASPPSAQGAAAGSREAGGSVRRPPPLSSYWFSPFSSLQTWCLRFVVAISFVYGGLVGWPMAASAALLPQLLLRMFTLGGCGLLLLYDLFFGLRWTYSRLLRQQRNTWVQQQLDLLLQENWASTMETAMKERQRLRELVAAMMRCLSATDPSAPLVVADPQPFAAEADAAAQAAMGGDLRMAGAHFGVSAMTIESALNAAKLQQLAEATRKDRQSLLRAAAAAGFWAVGKAMLRFVCCVPLLMVCIDIPASAAAVAADAAGWIPFLPAWLLPLVHAVARGCFAAAVLNLHVGGYAELAVGSSLDCFCYDNRPATSSGSTSSSSSKNCSEGVSGRCVFATPPQRWSLRLRLFFAFLLPIVFSVLIALGSTAAVGGVRWGLQDLVHLPLGLVHLAVELLPPELSTLLPLQQQRSRGADRLLLLLRQQHALGWLQWPKAEAADALVPAALLTAAAAVFFGCSTPSPLWEEHAFLEHVAAAAAVRKLLGQRELLLQKQPLCNRLSVRCSWSWRALCLWASTLPVGIASSLRRLGVFLVGLLWMLLLLSAVSNLPLLRTDEGELQTPLEALQQQLRRAEVQQMFVELRQLEVEFRRRSAEKGYEEAFDWLLQLLQDSWKQQLEAERSESDARAEALELFGLDEDAGAADIRHRYRQLAKQHHPDLAGAAANSSLGGQQESAAACGEPGDPNASDACKASHELMQKINLAYEVLLGQAGAFERGTALLALVSSFSSSRANRLEGFRRFIGDRLGGCTR